MAFQIYNLEYLIFDCGYNMKAVSIWKIFLKAPKKVAETENFAYQSCQIYFKGDKNTQSSCGAGRGEAELRTFDFKTTL